MSDLGTLTNDLVSASRILAAEGIVDGFGHISARHPERPDRFLISCVRAPELVTPEDVVVLDLHSEPVAANGKRLFLERVLHAAVYRLRPDVMAVCHHHAPAVLPFCATGIELVPVVHLGATMGERVPFWDSRDEFGDTDLLVSTPEQGLSMARALGPYWTVLLRRHGATVAGKSLRECVFRSIYGAKNAEVQAKAILMGAFAPLTKREAELAEALNLKSIAVDRSWERWRKRSTGAS